MPKTFTDLTRHALNGPTMGTRWQALFHVPGGFDAGTVQAAMAAAVGAVDAQMSTWQPGSDLMRLNAENCDVWVDLPRDLMAVLAAGLAIGKASGGAFDIGMGDAVTAWGFGPAMADEGAIRAAFGRARRPADQVLELDMGRCRARKHGPITLDLSGIAKGYGVDRLADVARAHGIGGALLAIDGEVRAIGAQPDGSPWAVAVERPDYDSRAAQSVIGLQDAAIATSGDYRHWVDLGARRLSHTMDPRRGGPLGTSPASVTVVAARCMEADAWATALMVRGSVAGAALARQYGLNVLFMDRRGDGVVMIPVGPLFEAGADPDCAA